MEERKEGDTKWASKVQPGLESSTFCDELIGLYKGIWRLMQMKGLINSSKCILNVEKCNMYAKTLSNKQTNNSWQKHTKFPIYRKEMQESKGKPDNKCWSLLIVNR